MTLASTTDSGFGTRTRRSALAGITTLIADTTRGQHISALLAELDDIDADRQMAGRFVEPGRWLSDLRVEERDTWDRIADELSA